MVDELLAFWLVGKAGDKGCARSHGSWSAESVSSIVRGVLRLADGRLFFLQHGEPLLVTVEEHSLFTGH